MLQYSSYHLLNITKLKDGSSVWRDLKYKQIVKDLDKTHADIVIAELSTCRSHIFEIKLWQMLGKVITKWWLVKSSLRRANTT